MCCFFFLLVKFSSFSSWNLTGAVHQLGIAKVRKLKNKRSQSLNEMDLWLYNRYMTYGNLGVVIGHEIVHGFDVNGNYIIACQ